MASTVAAGDPRGGADGADASLPKSWRSYPASSHTRSSAEGSLRVSSATLSAPDVSDALRLRGEQHAQAVGRRHANSGARRSRSATGGAGMG